MSVKSHGFRFARTERVRSILLTFAKACQFLNSSILPRCSKQIEIFSYVFSYFNPCLSDSVTNRILKPQQSQCGNKAVKCDFYTVSGKKGSGKGRGDFSNRVF